MGKNDAAAKPAKKVDEKKVIPETIKHIVTQEDLDNNPELVEKEINVGDEIDIVNPEYVAPAPPVVKPPVNKVEKAEIPNLENLKALLERQKHVHVLYVNEKGEWFFQARPGFKAYEREDILNG